MYRIYIYIYIIVRIVLSQNYIKSRNDPRREQIRRSDTGM